MKRIVWLGGAALIALAAAIPLWLVLDEDAVRSAAALQEPTGSGDVGRLTLVGKNGGNPISIRSFSLDLSRHVVEDLAGKYGVDETQYRLDLLRRIDNTSPVLFDLGVAETQANGELDVGAEKPYLRYSLDAAVVVEWSNNNKGEILGLQHTEVAAQLLGSAPAAPPSEVVGRMKIASLNDKPFPILAFDTGFEREVHQTTDTTRRFGAPPEHRPVLVKRAIDALAPQLIGKMQVTTPIPEVVVELIAPGTTTPYATYAYQDVLLKTLSDSGAAGSFPTQSITFVYDKVEIKTQSSSASAPS